MPATSTTRPWLGRLTCWMMRRHQMTPAWLIVNHPITGEFLERMLALQCDRCGRVEPYPRPNLTYTRAP